MITDCEATLIPLGVRTVPWSARPLVCLITQLLFPEILYIVKLRIQL